MPHPPREVCSHGHHASVLRSHQWRTAENSAAYLLSRLTPADRLLDVGIGPGTITVDFAGLLYEGTVVQVARANGGEPDAGRRLLSWAHAAGFSGVDSSASTWCFATPENLEWWSDTWAERLSHSDFAHQAVERGLSEPAELAQLARGWRRWAAHPGAWFAVLHGEILCRC